MTAKGEFFPIRTRQYVPEMHFAADVADSGFGTIEIPAMATAGDVIVNGNINAAGDYVPDTSQPTVEQTEFVMAKFGRNLVVTSDADVSVHGYDYLGQPMVEDFATGADVEGKKAFAFVMSVVAGGAASIKIETGAIFGLPYALVKYDGLLVDNEIAGDEPDAEAQFVDEQTASSKDPRGTIKFNGQTVPNGERSYSVHGWWNRKNLHGNRHFAG